MKKIRTLDVIILVLICISLGMNFMILNKLSGGKGSSGLGVNTGRTSDFDYNNVSVIWLYKNFDSESRNAEHNYRMELRSSDNKALFRYTGIEDNYFFHAGDFSVATFENLLELVTEEELSIYEPPSDANGK